MTDFARPAARSDRNAILVSVAVAVLALGPAVAGLAQAPGLDWLTVLLLIVLVLLAESRSLEMAGLSTYSISVVPMLAAGMLLGLPGAIIVAPVSAIVRGFRRHSRWYKILFNASTYILATAGATVVFGFFGPDLVPSNLLSLLGPAALAGVIFYLHTFLVAGGMATELRTPPVKLWAEHFQWLWPQYIVLSLMGLFLSLAYREYGLAGVAVFAIPPLMMRYVAKQYIDRTMENIRQLRELNDQLANEIAQRTAAEEENARLAVQAARAAALEELNQLKSDFISIASHELMTPMTTIRGFSELLSTQFEDEDPRARFVDIIHDDVVQLSVLVDDLLDISRIEGGYLKLEIGDVNLNEVLPPLVEMLGAPAPDHCLIIEIPPEAGWVRADPGKLSQILTNLISNAIKYSPAGGDIRISAAAVPDADRIAISVADPGIGIPADQLGKIFERFHRVESPEASRIRGTGLGLYIVQQLVQLQGGEIWVESQVGRGSTFCFTLPAANSPAPPTGDPTAPSRFALTSG